MEKKSKINREAKTVGIMISLFCKGSHHDSASGLCPSCASLETYALERLEKCAYGGKKTTCRKCPTHCYKQEFRDRIRTVMRYSGPRMLLRHPVLAIRHLLF
jgi:hypothetical protein